MRLVLVSAAVFRYLMSSPSVSGSFYWVMALRVCRDLISTHVQDPQAYTSFICLCAHALNAFRPFLGKD